MIKFIIILSALLCACCQNLNQLQLEIRDAAHCGIYVQERNQSEGTWTLGLRYFNDGAYRVKQASIVVSTNPHPTEFLFDWPGIGQTPGSITVPAPVFTEHNEALLVLSTFLLADDSIFCVITIYTEDFDCARGVYGLFCPNRIPSLRRPATCLVNGGPETSVSQCVIGEEPASDWACVNGNCVHIQNRDSNAECASLKVRPLVPQSVGSNGAIQFGMRLTDCEGSVMDSITAEQLVVSEQGNSLSVLDTKQKLEPISGKNYVQLMISMCPRTSPILSDLIMALHLFKRQLNFDDTYVALTVFDGARGYVDLVHFTDNYNTISYAIDGLRDYQLRDDSCNMFEAVNAKFTQFSSLKFGQPWDRLTFVLFSASADLTGFANGFTLAFYSRQEITSHFIGVDLPTSVAPLIDQFFDYDSVTNDANAIIGAFVDVARNLALRSDYLFGYCSPARQGDILARLDWLFPETSLYTILWSMNYNASSFRSCTVNLDYCSTCSTEISRSSIICLQCFNSPSQNIITPIVNDIQTFLHCPNNGGNDCSLSIVNITGSINIYIRKNALSNPLLYDNKFAGVDVTLETPLYLPFISGGDLVGVFIEWNDATVLDSSQILLIPTAATPDSAPAVAPYADAPYAWSDPNNPSADDGPISSVTNAASKFAAPIVGMVMGFVFV